MANTLKVKIKRLHADAVIPQYAREGDAGFDLVAVEDVIIEPGETALVKTGLAFELPHGYEMQVRPRSGVTLKTKLRVQLGTVDAGYRGEVGVIVDNTAVKGSSFSNDYVIRYEHLDGTNSKVPKHTREDKFHGEYIEYDKVPRMTYLIRKGDRIAQAVIKPVEQATFIEVDTLSETDRGEGGFGSSGVKHPEYFAVPVGKERI
ncbi:dUTP diphosphatase [Cytobacillus massiliigabonensis]|uniref:dUTP diphosphatase n=1 Tax=Cytobacillus massiliigabonensis TaxID=1871011 RepID=UPI000C847D20|nr:deoxyuridine 5'-triphosphate nucleotidohydrolase [Cytobacillus massiliigabonensis]